jgi:DNA-binding NarL/FixJ family response regulator
MILLATDNQKLSMRWNSAISTDHSKMHVNTLGELKDSLTNENVDVALIHLSLPELNSIADIKNLQQEYPDLKIFMLSDKPSELEAIELLKEGVLGYANSYIAVNYLKEAVKVVKLGEVWIGKRLMQWLVKQCTSFSDPGSVKYINMDDLTSSERKVADLLSKGNNNKTIAKALGITERTVKAHLSSIFRKTGVTDRLHLVLLLNGYGH